MKSTTATIGKLQVTRLIKAPAARVFAAWTTPSDLSHWFAPRPFTLTSATVDLKVGGQYRFQFAANGESNAVTGHFIEIKSPSRLVYTWRSEGNPEMDFGETRVTVEFIDVRGSTEVRLTHEGFVTPAIQDRHSHGWEMCFDNLAEFAGAKSAGA